MDATTRAELEDIGDRLEEIARALPEWGSVGGVRTNRTVKICAVAWDIKQIARAGTPSAGI